MRFIRKRRCDAAGNTVSKEATDDVISYKNISMSTASLPFTALDDEVGCSLSSMLEIVITILSKALERSS